MWCTYVCPPVTLPGMSTRGAVVPTSLYWLTGLAGATPCWSDVVVSVTLKTFPPMSSPYVTDLPAPETTPLLTDRLPTATPRREDASFTSSVRAATATARMRWPVLDIEFEPPIPPVSATW
jgi:hypothetical protein